MVRLQHEAEAAQAHHDRATLAATEIEGSKIRQQLLDVTNEVAELSTQLGASDANSACALYS